MVVSLDNLIALNAMITFFAFFHVINVINVKRDKRLFQLCQHLAFDRSCVLRRDGLVAALLAGDVARIAAVEMILPAMALQDFSFLGDAHAFGDHLTCFHFATHICSINNNQFTIFNF